MPKQEGRLRHPVVVLVGGAGAVDRDETVADIPIFGQLAGALADRGFMVLRYDKRGVGQSGGRIETRHASRLRRRRDRDRQVAGHAATTSTRGGSRSLGYGEGGAVGAARRGTRKEDRVARAGRRDRHAAAPTSCSSSSGTQLDLMKISDADRQAKIDLQKKIQAAVLTDTGWEGIPEDVRKQADTPWFKSLLDVRPGEGHAESVKQPILIVQGDLDTQVPPHHADQLAELARAAQEGAAGRSGPPAGRQSSARAGHDRRGRRISRRLANRQIAARRRDRRSPTGCSSDRLAGEPTPARRSTRLSAA